MRNQNHNWFNELKTNKKKKKKKKKKKTKKQNKTKNKRIYMRISASENWFLSVLFNALSDILDRVLARNQY